MADRSRGLSWLTESGYTQTCMARGTVTWKSKDHAARELQLWYHERDDDYCLYACKTARDDMVVCEVINVFNNSSLPKVHSLTKSKRY